MLKKPERRNDLYLPKSEYDRLYDQYHRPEHNRKAMEKIKERIEDIKETQKDVRKTWPVKQSGGTERESLLKFRKLQMDKQLTDFEESQRLRGIETQEYIQKVRKSLMMKQSDPLTLLMAMRIGRVNHERSKQIEMKKMLEDHDRKVEEAFNEKVIREAEDEKREKEEEKRIRKEKEMQHGKLLMQQILNEREMNVKKREAKHKQEEFDNIKNAEEMAALQKQTWEEVQEYRRNLKTSCDEDVKQHEEMKEKLRVEDEHQEEVINLYLETKHFIECTKKIAEKKKLDEKIRRAQEFGVANEAQMKALADIQEAKFAKSVQEKEQIEEERRLKELEKQEKFKKEALEIRENCLLKAELHKKSEEELLKYFMLNRYKQTEIINDSLQQDREKRWKNTLEFREGLFQQMDEAKEASRRASNNHEEYILKEAEKLKATDAEILNYCGELEELCKKKNWDTYAINRVREQYVREHALEPRKKNRSCIQEGQNLRKNDSKQDIK